MSKKRIIIILGLVIALLPLSGIPRNVREALSTLAGLAIAIIAFLLKRKVEREALQVKNDTFSQNGAYKTRPQTTEPSSGEPLSL